MSALHIQNQRLVLDQHVFSNTETTLGVSGKFLSSLSIKHLPVFDHLFDTKSFCYRFIGGDKVDRVNKNAGPNTV